MDMGSNELHKRVYFLKVVKGPKSYFFGNVRSYSLLTTFFVLMSKQKGWINFKKQIYRKF